jgi:hypothetical protein
MRGSLLSLARWERLGMMHEDDVEPHGIVVAV